MDPPPNDGIIPTRLELKRLDARHFRLQVRGHPSRPMTTVQRQTSRQHEIRTEVICGFGMEAVVADRALKLDLRNSRYESATYFRNFRSQRPPPGRRPIWIHETSGIRSVIAQSPVAVETRQLPAVMIKKAAGWTGLMKSP